MAITQGKQRQILRNSERSKQQGRSMIEDCAHPEAQMRCCSDQHYYRIIQEDTNEVVSMMTPNTYRSARVTI